MKIKIDENTRRYVEIDIEFDGKSGTVKYYETNGNQFNEGKALAKNTDAKGFDVLDLSEKHFFENLQGDKELIDGFVASYTKNRPLHTLIEMFNKELGKHINGA
jgi:hypothetical protein